MIKYAAAHVARFTPEKREGQKYFNLSWVSLDELVMSVRREDEIRSTPPEKGVIRLVTQSEKSSQLRGIIINESIIA